MSEQYTEFDESGMPKRKVPPESYPGREPKRQRGESGNAVTAEVSEEKKQPAPATYYFVESSDLDAIVARYTAVSADPQAAYPRLSVLDLAMLRAEPDLVRAGWILNRAIEVGDARTCSEQLVTEFPQLLFRLETFSDLFIKYPTNESMLRLAVMALKHNLQLAFVGQDTPSLTLASADALFEVLMRYLKPLCERKNPVAIHTALRVGLDDDLIKLLGQVNSRYHWRTMIYRHGRKPNSPIYELLEHVHARLLPDDIDIRKKEVQSVYEMVPFERRRNKDVLPLDILHKVMEDDIYTQLSTGGVKLHKLFTGEAQDKAEDAHYREAIGTFSGFARGRFTCSTYACMNEQRKKRHMAFVRATAIMNHSGEIVSSVGELETALDLAEYVLNEVLPHEARTTKFVDDWMRFYSGAPGYFRHDGGEDRQEEEEEDGGGERKAAPEPTPLLAHAKWLFFQCLPRMAISNSYAPLVRFYIKNMHVSVIEHFYAMISLFQSSFSSNGNAILSEKIDKREEKRVPFDRLREMGVLKQHSRQDMTIIEEAGPIRTFTSNDFGQGMSHSARGPLNAHRISLATLEYEFREPGVFRTWGPYQIAGDTSLRSSRPRTLTGIQGLESKRAMSPEPQKRAKGHSTSKIAPLRATLAKHDKIDPEKKLDVKGTVELMPISSLGERNVPDRATDSKMKQLYVQTEEIDEWSRYQSEIGLWASRVSSLDTALENNINRPSKVPVSELTLKDKRVARIVYRPSALDARETLREVTELPFGQQRVRRVGQQEAAVRAPADSNSISADLSSEPIRQPVHKLWSDYPEDQGALYTEKFIGVADRHTYIRGHEHDKPLKYLFPEDLPRLLMSDPSNVYNDHVYDFQGESRQVRLGMLLSTGMRADHTRKWHMPVGDERSPATEHGLLEDAGSLYGYRVKAVDYHLIDYNEASKLPTSRFTIARLAVECSSERRDLHAFINARDEEFVKRFFLGRLVGRGFFRDFEAFVEASDFYRAAQRDIEERKATRALRTTRLPGYADELVLFKYTASIYAHFEGTCKWAEAILGTRPEGEKLPNFWPRDLYHNHSIWARFVEPARDAVLYYRQLASCIFGNNVVALHKLLSLTDATFAPLQPIKAFKNQDAPEEMSLFKMAAIANNVACFELLHEKSLVYMSELFRSRAYERNPQNRVGVLDSYTQLLADALGAAAETGSPTIVQYILTRIRPRLTYDTMISALHGAIGGLSLRSFSLIANNQRVLDRAIELNREGVDVSKQEADCVTLLFAMLYQTTQQFNSSLNRKEVNPNESPSSNKFIGRGYGRDACECRSILLEMLVSPVILSILRRCDYMRAQANLGYRDKSKLPAYIVGLSLNRAITDAFRHVESQDVAPTTFLKVVRFFRHTRQVAKQQGEVMVELDRELRSAIIDEEDRLFIKNSVGIEKEPYAMFDWYFAKKHSEEKESKIFVDGREPVIVVDTDKLVREFIYYSHLLDAYFDNYIAIEDISSRTFHRDMLSWRALLVSPEHQKTIMQRLTVESPGTFCALPALPRYGAPEDIIGKAFYMLCGGPNTMREAHFFMLMKKYVLRRPATQNPLQL